MAVERFAGEAVRVVVADDDDETRTVLVRLFDDVDELDVVGAASDLATAVDLVDKHAPDVVLLDRVMPGVDGPSTIEDLRRRAPAAAIVVVSGYGRDDPEVAAVADVADGYVEKGASRTTIVRTVLRSVERPMAATTTPAAPTDGGVPPTLATLADRLHDGPVQVISSALWTLDALERTHDAERRQELVEQLRTALQTSLATSRQLMRWARQEEGGNGADPPR